MPGAGAQPVPWGSMSGPGGSARPAGTGQGQGKPEPGGVLVPAGTGTERDTVRLPDLWSPAEGCGRRRADPGAFSVRFLMR